MIGAEPEKTYFADFEIDRGRRHLLKDGRNLSLNAKAFDLLVFLTDNPGRIVSKDEILNSIWKDQFVEESNLSVQISAIRKVLGDSASDPRFLATIPGKGYQFVAETYKSDPTETVPVEMPTESTGTQTSNRGVWLAAGIGLLVLALVVVFAGRILFFSSPPAIKSVAVLPFLDPGGDAEYLGDGLAESVIFSLSRVPTLKVLSSGSSFRYRSEKPDAMKMGRDLGVDAILIGRIVHSGDTLSVSAELVSTADDSVIWGDQLSRKLSDVEKLQADIAQAITQRLRIKLTGADEGRLSREQTQNEEAYNYYLIGRYHLNRLTDDGFLKARDNFKLAIEKDPGYPLAHAGLADSYNMLCGWGSLDPGEGYPLAKAAALRSLELDDSLAEGHAALGITKLFYDTDWAGAETEFARARERNPSLVSAWQYQTLLYSLQSRFDEALVSIERARELDPLSILNIILRGNVHYFQRQPGPAIEAYLQAVELDPNSGLAHWSLGNGYFLANRFDDAIAEYDKAVSLSGDSPDEKASIAFTRAVRGDRTEARKILDELAGRNKYVPPSLLASIYGAMGEKDKAFDLLEDAFRKKDSALLYLAVDPIFDPLRSDARFPVLLKRLGLGATN